MFLSPWKVLLGQSDSLTGLGPPWIAPGVIIHSTVFHLITSRWEREPNNVIGLGQGLSAAPGPPVFARTSLRPEAPVLGVSAKPCPRCSCSSPICQIEQCECYKGEDPGEGVSSSPQMHGELVSGFSFSYFPWPERAQIGPLALKDARGSW